MDEIIFKYTDVTGRKCGFILSVESQLVSHIIWQAINKTLKFMQENGTIVNYSGDTYRRNL